MFLRLLTVFFLLFFVSWMRSYSTKSEGWAKTMQHANKNNHPKVYFTSIVFWFKSMEKFLFSAKFFFRRQGGQSARKARHGRFKKNGKIKNKVMPEAAEHDSMPTISINFAFIIAHA